MIQCSAVEAQQRLPELLAKASHGEVVQIIEDGNRFCLTVLEVDSPSPRPPITGIPKAGRLKGMFVVPDDFDDPLEDLREYME